MAGVGGWGAIGGKVAEVGEPGAEHPRRDREGGTGVKGISEEPGTGEGGRSGGVAVEEGSFSGNCASPSPEAKAQGGKGVGPQVRIQTRSGEAGSRGVGYQGVGGKGRITRWPFSQGKGRGEFRIGDPVSARGEGKTPEGRFYEAVWRWFAVEGEGRGILPGRP